MTYWVAVYRANLRTAVAQMLQYRFGILIWAVWGFVGPLISLAVWSAATSARGGAITNGVVAYSQRDFAAYFLVYMVVGHLVMSWDAFEFAFRVRDGNLSPRLLKPLNPIHGDLTANIAFKLATTAMILPAWVLLFTMLHPSPPRSLPEFLLGIPAVLLAGLLRFVLQYSLALAAFWTTRVEAINELYFALDSFLAGRIAPLALLPAWMAAVAAYSPFRGMGAFPVELLLGRLDAGQVTLGFLSQIAWLAVAIGIFRAMWAAGVRQYSAVGA
ncbi:MAG TPA: ABC-2 family transporter protein [Chthonomonadaceae bacterium]|nr:ABC-2 family transporter protein [Chthonomonadaceae bacterium]